MYAPLHVLLAEPVTIKRLIPLSQGRCASFCLSWMTDAYDPGVSSPAQPVVGNRKHHYPAIATHSGIGARSWSEHWSPDLGPSTGRQCEADEAEYLELAALA
jgi:hypothetical protein